MLAWYQGIEYLFAHQLLTSFLEETYKSYVQFH